MTIFQPSAVLVKDIMSTDIKSVTPDTSLIKAASVIAVYHFNGLPVVDEHNKLVGIITEYDLLSKSVPAHLPTMQMILQNLHVFGKDKSHFASDLEPLFSLKVGDLMNKEPMILKQDATYEEAMEIFKNHHRVNPIPVVDDDRNVVGVVSRFDILKPLYALKNEAR